MSGQPCSQGWSRDNEANGEASDSCRLSLEWGLVIVATVLTFAFRSRTVDEQGLR
jgi:hypothetical protein